MKKTLTMFVTALVLGISLWNPAVLLAGEHGGKEHAGEEQGGMAMEASASQGAEDAATLREAAEVLRATRPDLAEKLEKMAGEKSGE